MTAAVEPRFHLTVTVNYSDGTEVNDIDVPATVRENEIGEAAMDLGMLNASPGATVTSLVIVAVVAASGRTAA